MKIQKENKLMSLLFVLLTVSIFINFLLFFTYSCEKRTHLQIENELITELDKAGKNE